MKVKKFPLAAKYVHKNSKEPMYKYNINSYVHYI